MNIGKIAHRDVITIGPDANVVEAAKLMRKHHVGDVIVVGEGMGRPIPLGIVTDRDLVVGVIAQEVDTPSAIKVGDITGRTLHTAMEDEDLSEVRKRMWSNGIRRIPIVDDAGTLVGVVAYDDLVRYLAEELADLTRLTPRQQKREQQTRR